jgi:hypothetical protein
LTVIRVLSPAWRRSWNNCASKLCRSRLGIGSRGRLSLWGCTPGRLGDSPLAYCSPITTRFRICLRGRPWRHPPLRFSFLAGLRLRWNRRRHRKSRSPRGTLLLLRRRSLCLRLLLLLLLLLLSPRPVTGCGLVLERRPVRLLSRRLPRLLRFLFGLPLLSLWSRFPPCRTCFVAGIRLPVFPPRLPLGLSRLLWPFPGVRIARLVPGYPVVPPYVCPFFVLVIHGG